MRLKTRKPKVWTYADLREGFAVSLTWLSVLALLSYGVGLSTLWLTLPAAALLVASAGISRSLRSLKEMDSPVQEVVERWKLPEILSAAVGAVLFLAGLLMVPLTGWSFWVSVAMPLAGIVLVRASFLASDQAYRTLAAASLVSLAWLLAFDGWGPRMLFWTGTLAALGLVVSSRLWERLAHGILKGKIQPAEWLANWTAPAAGWTAILLAAFLAAPSLPAAWNPARTRPGTSVRIEIDWNEDPARPADPANPDRPRTPSGTVPASTPGASGAAKTIVLRTPQAANLRSFLRIATGLLRRRLVWILSAAAFACAVWLFVRKRMKSRRKGPGAGAKLSEFLDKIRRTATRKRLAPPEEAPADPRRAVLFLYNQIRSDLARHGYKKQPHLAPREYAQFLGFRLGDQRQRIDRITGIFEAACYGPAQTPPAERDAMGRECRALRLRVQTDG